MSAAVRARALAAVVPEACAEVRAGAAPASLAPDDPLLLAAADGDEAAMQTLALRILPRVRNTVRYLVRGDAIDDLTQDVLVTVLERLDSYTGAGRFESWVNGVALRVVLGRMRKRRADERRLVPAAPEAMADETDGRALQKYATSRQLVRALDQLSDNHRRALVMHHVFGWTVSEIARELAAPHETIRTRLRDGMGQLRALLRVNGTGVTNDGP